MTDKPWKAGERRVARKLSARRNPLSGRINLGEPGDVLLEGYTIEVKTGKSQIPKSVLGWLATLRSVAKKNTIPILVLCPFALKEQIVVLTLTDFSTIVEAARGATMMAD